MGASFAFLIATVLMHPVHETVSEIEWNSETSRMEVAIRMSALDEQWIQRRLDSSNGVSKWGVNYLGTTFRFDPVDKPSKSNAVSKPLGEPAKPSHRIHWVGREEEGSHVWWYVEIEPLDHKRPRMIEQRMFFERNQGYTNRVVLLGQVPRKAITLTIQKSKTKLDWKADDRTKQRAGAAAAN